MKIKKQIKIRIKWWLFNVYDYFVTKFEKSKTKSILFPFIFVLVFSFGHFANATTTISIQTATGGSNVNSTPFSQQKLGQSFKPRHANVVKIDLLYIPNKNFTGDARMYLCKGIASSTTFNSTYNCTASGNTFVASSSVLATAFSNVGTTVSFTFATTSLNIGEDYYFSYWIDNVAGDKLWESYGYNNSNLYTDGYALPYNTGVYASTNYDTYFTLWYDSGYSSLYLTSPTFGQRFYNTDVLISGTFSNYGLMYNQAIIKILNKSNWTALNDIVIDIATSTGTFSGNFSLADFPDGNYRLYGNLVNTQTGLMSTTSNKIDFVTGTTTIFTGAGDQKYQTGSLLTTEQVCNGIDTTTFFGGVECGFKKVIAWSFTPNSGTIDNLKSSYTNLQGAFPFTVFFKLTNTISGAISSTTLSRNGTFDVVMINKQKQLITVPVLSSSSMPKLIGQINTDLIRNTISWFMWLAIAFLIFLQFKNI